MTVEELLSRFGGVRRNGSGWMARCPAHEDRAPSLSIAVGSAGYVFKCHAGCATEAILDRVGLFWKDVFFDEGLEADPPRRIVASYPYVDEDGRLQFEVVRYDPKGFAQRRPDGQGGWIWNLADTGRPLYRLPEVLAAIKEGGTVISVEGEKNADALCGLGLVATTCPMGAGKWRPEHTEALRGAPRVVVIPDDDTPGRSHAQAAAAALLPVVGEVRLVDLFEAGESKRDVFDWLASLPTSDPQERRKLLLDRVEATATYTPPTVTVPASREESEESERSRPASVVSSLSSLSSQANSWPEAPPATVYYGLAGEFVRTVEPHSEVDPLALLVQFLAAFGSLIGRQPHVKVEADKHPGNLFVVLVGATSRARKGTSAGYIRRLFQHVDADWSTREANGLSSGEGLIHAVRDTTTKEDENGAATTVEEGVADKRLFVSEGEFASVLRVMRRESSTLSAVLRNAWDGGRLSTLTKNSPTTATDTHISLIGHITVDELRRELRESEAANGFGNRFLWVCVKRSKLLPDGGQLKPETLESLAETIRTATTFAKTVETIGRDPAASRLWHREYEHLTREEAGLVGSLTARAEAQVTRLSLLYALLDSSPLIRQEHLQAALDLWEYTARSVRHIFGFATGNPDADTVEQALRQAPAGLTKTELYARFSRHLSAGRLDNALHFLRTLNRAHCTEQPTGGRPAERWHHGPGPDNPQ